MPPFLPAMENRVCEDDGKHVVKQLDRGEFSHLIWISHTLCGLCNSLHHLRTYYEEGDIFLLAPLSQFFFCAKTDSVCPIFRTPLISTDNICNLLGGRERGHYSFLRL